jgi:hypothetical protein
MTEKDPNWIVAVLDDLLAKQKAQHAQLLLHRLVDWQELYEVNLRLARYSGIVPTRAAGADPCTRWGLRTRAARGQIPRSATNGARQVRRGQSTRSRGCRQGGNRPAPRDQPRRLSDHRPRGKPSLNPAFISRDVPQRFLGEAACR